MQKEEIKGNRFCVNEIYAIDLDLNKIYSKNKIINLFKEKCASDKVKKAIYEIDKNEKGQTRHGIIVFGIQSKDEEMMTLYYHENNYEEFKDEISLLYSCVLNVQDKIDRKKQIIRRIATGTLIVGSAIALLASKFKIFKTNNYSLYNTISNEQNILIKQLNNK